jgi:hypothetical protein
VSCTCRCEAHKKKKGSLLLLVLLYSATPQYEYVRAARPSFETKPPSVTTVCCCFVSVSRVSVSCQCCCCCCCCCLRSVCQKLASATCYSTVDSRLFQCCYSLLRPAPCIFFVCVLEAIAPAAAVVVVVTVAVLHAQCTLLLQLVLPLIQQLLLLLDSDGNSKCYH